MAKRITTRDVMEAIVELHSAVVAGFEDSRQRFERIEALLAKIEWELSGF